MTHRGKRAAGTACAGSGAVLEAPALVAGLDDLAMVGQAIEQGCGHLGVAEDGVDPSRKSGGALHRLHCFCLEFDGACEVQRRVPTDWIIEPVDVSGYGSFSLAS